MAVTREEALKAIDDAKIAMVQAINLAEVAKQKSTESGILTAADIIGEGLAEARAQAFALLPSVTDYVGTQTSQADVESVQGAKKEVEEAARAAGSIIAMLVKAALKFAL